MSIAPRPRPVTTAIAALAMLATAAAASPADDPVVEQIIATGEQDEGAMEIARYLADDIGPRLTNSPGAREAEAWTQSQLREYGLQNVHAEGFEFGRGWWMERSSVRMIEPRPKELAALPISWTPSTRGPIQAPVILAPLESAADFEAWRGKLAGKIVLVTPTDAARTPPVFERLSDEDLAQMEAAKPAAAPAYRSGKEAVEKYIEFPRQRDRFLKAEGALAWISMSRLDGMLVMSDGEGFETGHTPVLPAVGMAVEDYRRLARLSQSGTPPVVEIDNVVHFTDGDTRAYNIFADIPGTDADGEYVMAGAHLDSAAAADGASDDGAGIAIVMQAARILAKMPRPRRTIRFALWGGEEQGMLGLIAYADRNLATRGKPDASLTLRRKFHLWDDLWPITPQPGWNDLSVYFNVDNGAGRIRGIYSDGDLAATPMLRDWLAPFAQLGATTVAPHADDGADHEFLQTLGLPGYQVIQDSNDYGRMHHTSMDTLDHIDPDDLQQAATVLAGLLWRAANAKTQLPREAFPTR